MSHLALAGDVTDKAGMASTVLAAQVGYPGSSIAFAQLLSGMERAGLIQREVRGKRTYRITAAAGARVRVAPAMQRRPAARTAEPAPAGRHATAAVLTAETVLAAEAVRAAEAVLAAGEGGRHLAAADTAPGDFDYDELARRLLVQVVRRLASVPAEERRDASHEQTVAGLEQELATVRTLHSTLTEENARLREQLRAVRRSLALAQDRADRRQLSDQLDAAEVGLLERLLAPSGRDGRREDPGTG
jgi:hypothetical protein